jgi:prepilin-type N-terminal cleavage/methylation domain-containing protein
MNSSKGFTLIELLVVISIIALLSSVVLAAVGTARNKAFDSAVKAAMRQLLTQSQNYLDSYSDFGMGVNGCNSSAVNPNLFYTDTKTVEILNNIAKNAGTAGTLRCTTDSATGQYWAMSVSALRGGGTWCVDSSGWTKAGIA